MASCEECDAKCCRYVAVDLATPKDGADWDEIKWMLMHKDVIVYKEDDDEWVVEFKSKCKHLDEKTNKCKIYDKRPDVCKDHETHECESNGEDFAEIIFSKPEDVDKYLKKIKK